MKKSPLKRKTPLKRGQALKTKTRLKQKSDKRYAWHKKYRDQRNKDNTIQTCAKTGWRTHKANLDAHHPFGRSTEQYTLCYIYITREFHDWIHSNSREAMEQGWLQPSYRALPHNPDWTKPWIEGTLIGGAWLNALS